MTTPAHTDERRADARSRRPAANEIAPYQQAYVAHVPAGDVLESLVTQLGEALQLAASFPGDAAFNRYAAGKWSAAEVFGHITDLERAFGLRAMCFARKDPGPLPSVDEDPYVAAADFDGRGLSSIITEFEHLRRANLALFASFAPEVLDRRGVASGFDLSVRGLLYLTAGHAAHHLHVLRERYMNQ
jgi:hypothetical protein